MREGGHRPSQDETSGAAADGPAPGKRSAVQRIARRAEGPAGDPAGALAGVAASTGSSLPDSARVRFEASLEADLSAVRVHTGPESNTAAAQLGARAFTTGNDIHFGAGQYQPDDPYGMHLLAHEVAHTVQQQGATPVARAKLEVSAPGDPCEREADSAADAMVRGERATVSAASASSAARMIHRLAEAGGGERASAEDTGELDAEALAPADDDGGGGPFESPGGGGPIPEEDAAPLAREQGEGGAAAADEEAGSSDGGGGGDSDGQPGEAGETEYMNAKGRGAEAGGDTASAGRGQAGRGEGREAGGGDGVTAGGASAGGASAGGASAGSRVEPDQGAEAPPLTAAIESLGAGGGNTDPDAGNATADVPAPTVAGAAARGGGGHEATADAIADHAVRGESAAALTRTAAGTAPAGSVQRKGDAGTELLEAGWGDLNAPGIVYQDTGANLRSAPSKDAPATWLPQNTKVFILKHNPAARWYAVTTAAGQLGYVADWLMFRHVPEPGADVYQIKAGDTPIEIARSRYGKDFTRWGQDQRFVVNALVYVNNKVKHNGAGMPGLVKPGGVTESWIRSQAKADVYIWLPSVNYLNMIYEEVRTRGGGTGSISYDLFADVAGALGEWTVIPSYVGGLVHGFVACVAETIHGLFSLVKSIFSGEIISQLEGVYNALKKLTFADLENALGAWWQSWKPRLLSDNPFVRGHAWGYLAGYLIGEIALFALAGGALNALKASKLATRLGQLLSKVVPRLVSGIDKIKKMGGAIATAVGEAKDAVLKRFGKAVAPAAPVVAPVVAALRKVSTKMREKILWGTMRQPGSNHIIGGHFRGIIGHPDYAVEIVGNSAVNPGCVRVKFIKKLPNGNLSNIKSPASTLFPRGWSKSDIIKAIEKIANDPAAWSARTVQSGNGASLVRGTVKGVKLEVVIDTAGDIIAGYPL